MGSEKTSGTAGTVPSVQKCHEDPVVRAVNNDCKFESLVISGEHLLESVVLESSKLKCLKECSINIRFKPQKGLESIRIKIKLKGLVDNCKIKPIKASHKNKKIELLSCSNISLNQKLRSKKDIGSIKKSDFIVKRKKKAELGQYSQTDELEFDLQIQPQLWAYLGKHASTNSDLYYVFNYFNPFIYKAEVVFAITTCDLMKQVKLVLIPEILFEFEFNYQDSSSFNQDYIGKKVSRYNLAELRYVSNNVSFNNKNLADSGLQIAIEDPRFNLIKFKFVVPFVANCNHESGYFKTVIEGEKFVGEREIYKGRGFIQLTHKRNYLAFGEFMSEGDAYLVNPSKVESSPYSSLSAAWYFCQFEQAEINVGSKLTCKAIIGDSNIDSNNGFYDLVCKHINGGFNGRSDRMNSLAAVFLVLRKNPHDFTLKFKNLNKDLFDSYEYVHVEDVYYFDEMQPVSASDIFDSDTLSNTNSFGDYFKKSVRNLFNNIIIYPLRFKTICQAPFYFDIFSEKISGSVKINYDPNDLGVTPQLHVNLKCQLQVKSTDIVNGVQVLAHPVILALMKKIIDQNITTEQKNKDRMIKDYDTAISNFNAKNKELLKNKKAHKADIFDNNTAIATLTKERKFLIENKESIIYSEWLSLLKNASINLKIDGQIMFEYSCDLPLDFISFDSAKTRVEYNMSSKNSVKFTVDFKNIPGTLKWGNDTSQENSTIRLQHIYISLEEKAYYLNFGFEFKGAAWTVDSINSGIKSEKYSQDKVWEGKYYNSLLHSKHPANDLPENCKMYHDIKDSWIKEYKFKIFS